MKTNEKIIYTKKEHMTDQSLNQRSYFKKYHVFVESNDVKQMEPSIYTLMYIIYTLFTRHWQVRVLPMAWDTWVQSQVESYQRLKIWYLMPPCLTLSNIR